MLNEIYQQAEIEIPKYSLSKKYDEIIIFGCGSSYNAGLISKFYIEEFLKTRCTVCYSSDLQYNNLSLYPEKTLFIAISQSGQTADTIRILEKLKDRDTLVVTNDDMSQCALLAKNVIYLDCGTEYAVASTKTFTSSILSILNMIKGLVG